MKALRWMAVGLVVLAVVAALGSVGPARGTSVGGGDSATLSLSASGNLTTSFNITDPNGSALRMAMDGNFTTIIDALPLNNTTRAMLIEELALLEATSPGLFGDHNGVVSSAEVTKFENLIQNGLARLSTSGLPSVTNVTLDGAVATSTVLDSISFQSAEGPVTSSAPIYVLATTSETFSLSGAGAHTLSVSVSGLGSLAPLLPTAPPSLAVSFTAPAGTSISHVTGLTQVTTTNDVWGWASPSAQGTYVTGGTTAVAFTFAPATPWGTVVVVVIPVGAAAVVGAILLLRHRRRRNTESTETEVKPSGSP